MTMEEISGDLCHKDFVLGLISDLSQLNNVLRHMAIKSPRSGPTKLKHQDFIPSTPSKVTNSTSMAVGW